ncbi:glycosyltransferase [Methylobacterium brachiatum]
MRILVCAENIFSAIGGGQSFYADLMKAYPSKQFFYFAENPENEINVPSHVHAIRIGRSYRDLENRLSTDGFFLGGYDLSRKKYDLLYFLDLATSVIGHKFDIIDIPDYVAYGRAFPAALKALGIDFGKVAVSLHGTLTDGVTENWATVFSPEELEHMRDVEDSFLREADICYAISPSYLAQREEQTGCKGRVLDFTKLIPFNIFKSLRTEAAKAASQRESPRHQPPPALAFIGRQEKWKGPDLFIDMAAGMPRDATSATLLIGPETHFGNVSSGDQLQKLARNRSLEFDHRVYAREELWEMLAQSRLVAVFPSRRDTLNLAALETLLTGTPAVISTAAGICRFLDIAFPGLPFTRMDPDDLGNAKKITLDLLQNYERNRVDLVAYLNEHEALSTGESLDSIYSGVDRSGDVGRLGEPFAEVFDHLVRGAVEIARSQLRDGLSGRLPDILGFSGMPKDEAEDLAGRFTHALDQAYELRRYEAELDATLVRQPFLSDQQMDQVWSFLEPFCYSINRIPVYRLLARLEKARGNLLLYATYQIRCMRLSGRSNPDVLEEVVGILRDHKFPEEAEAARWMYGETYAYQLAKQYLEAMSSRFPEPPSGDVERILDERTIQAPKVSIIVSLYRAADKLPVFFDGLARLSEATKAMTEIVLVDSFSPDDTFAVVQQLIAHHRENGWHISVYYVRTSVRETIQRAWNRGIAAAKAPYLSFLGVDEMNRSDAFDIMAEHLDRHSDVDWVQGTALVTEVNTRGSYVRDVMLYDRMFNTDYMNVFDTCYIGYVGALYRKEIHDRVGYYDDRFRGAGDSEFKNRVLPHIRAVTLPICLGYFLNYPEERTTASPMAEIEDIRAWYLYRSPAGAEVIFRSAREDQLMSILRDCMHYRKSYLQDISTDVELAHSICSFIENSDHPLQTKLVDHGAIVRWMRDTYRMLDSISEKTHTLTGVRFVEEIAATIERAAFSLSSVRHNLARLDFPAPLRFFNDNRSHQHHYLWRSRAQKLLIDLEEADVELAGPQDFAESLSACGATDQAVDFESAWAANDLHQLRRLQSEASLDVALEWTEQSSVVDLVRAFKEAVGDQRSLVVVGARPPLRHTAPRVYFTGPVTRPGPAIFSARSLVVRHDPVNASATIVRLVRAIWSGLPFVADQKSVRDLAAILPGVDLSAIEVVDSLPSALQRAAHLADRAQKSNDCGLVVQSLREILEVHPQVVMLGTSVGARPLSSRSVAKTFRLNRVIRERYENQGLGSALALATETVDEDRPLMIGLLNALFADKSAPILQTTQPVFRRIKAESPVPALV